MAIYGSYLEAVNKLEENVALTKEELAFVKESFVRTCIEIAESASFDEEAVTEGANMDMIRIIRDCRKEFKGEAAQCKAALKAKKYADAKKATKAMRATVEKGKKAVKDLDVTAGSVVFGYFTAFIVSAARNIVWVLGTSIASGVGSSLTAAGFADFMDDFESDLDNAKMKAGSIITNAAMVASYVKGIFNFVGTLKQFCKDLDDKDTKTAEALNMFRNQIMQAFGDLEKQIDKFDKIIDKEAASNK